MKPYVKRIEREFASMRRNQKSLTREQEMRNRQVFNIISPLAMGVIVHDTVVKTVKRLYPGERRLGVILPAIEGAIFGVYRGLEFVPPPGYRPNAVMCLALAQEIVSR